MSQAELSKFYGSPESNCSKLGGNCCTFLYSIACCIVFGYYSYNVADKYEPRLVNGGGCCVPIGVRDANTFNNMVRPACSNDYDEINVSNRF